MPEVGVCLITDDGSLLSGQVVQRLVDQGWKAVVLQLPEALVKPSVLATQTDCVQLQTADEAEIKQQLCAIAKTYGTIHTFIHLHPGEGVDDKSIVKAVFFMAKHLQAFLSGANEQPAARSAIAARRSFITVAHLDGELGLGRQSYRAVVGGLFGLTKTLRLEWPTVFCRAIDISSELSVTEAANALIAEMHDPNVFIREVGHGRSGRVTLTCLSETA